MTIVVYIKAGSFNTENRVLLSHGDGGEQTHALISRLFLKYFSCKVLHRLEDAAILPNEDYQQLALTTDSYVISPRFFPGGDLGRLAVYGTVNDLAVSGAIPKYITVGMIIEEGFCLNELEALTVSIAQAAETAGVEIAAGDTKVVERGNCDGLFINTTGLGFIRKNMSLGADRIHPGDRVIVNGSLGEHGVTVMSGRGFFDFSGHFQSDCAPLNHVIDKLFQRDIKIKYMRDLTRGGLGNALKEVAEGAVVDIFIDEESIPVQKQVRGAAELFGMDPLYLANEGKFLAVVDAKDAACAVELLQQDSSGKNAVCIGKIMSGTGQAFLRTPLGGTRILERLNGEQIPRIC